MWNAVVECWINVFLMKPSISPWLVYRDHVHLSRNYDVRLTACGTLSLTTVIDFPSRGWFALLGRFLSNNFCNPRLRYIRCHQPQIRKEIPKTHFHLSSGWSRKNHRIYIQIERQIESTSERWKLLRRHPPTHRSRQHLLTSRLHPLTAFDDLGKYANALAPVIGWHLPPFASA